MRIGFIEDTHLRGGTQIWVTEAVEDFIEKGEECIVIGPEGSFVADECRKLGAMVFTYDWDDIPANPDKYQKNWAAGLKEMDVAVCTVHPPRNGFHCSVFGAKCIQEAGLETILIPKTGTIVPDYLREYYQPDDRINAHVISITKFTQAYLISDYKIPAEKVQLIYQGTEVDRFTSTPEAEKEAFLRYSLPGNAGPILASLGSFEERKGQIILLQAIADLAAGPLPNVHAMMVGEGPDEEMLKAKVDEMGIGNHVTFFPFTREPNYVFERIDILTLPSLYKEGLPNVLLEAMSMGLPVVASEMAGVPEIVFNGETGYMVPPGEVEEFKKAVVKLWHDPEACRQMGRNARKLMEEKFDKVNQYAEFLSFFHQISTK